MMTVEYIGIIASFFAILMFASPIAQIREIINDKNSHRVSPLLYGMMILNCVFWVIYGFGINNIYIITPNSIGALIGAITLFFIFKYRKIPDIG